MKKTFVKLLALSFALVMAIPIFASCKKEQAKIQAASHLIIDINPSLSLSLDKKNRVVSVHASNEDAQVMLYGEQLIGLKVEVALEKIAQLSLDLNYINDDNHGVSVVVSGKLGENEVISTLKSVYDKQAGKLEINFTTDGNFSDLRELEALKAQFAQNLEVQKLTIKEYKLIAEAQMVDASLAIEEAVKMSRDELTSIIADSASKIEPYATKAYNRAFALAERTYNELKGQLVDSLWIAPYAKDYLNILTGRKYKVNNGALYNLYTGSSRALGVAIDVIEQINDIANTTLVPNQTLNSIATALNLTEEQKAQFISEVTKDGDATLESVEKYLNKWFKNLTVEERAALEGVVNQVLAEVQSFAVTIENSISKEVKDEILDVVDELEDLVPADLELLAESYMAEFTLLADQLASAVNSKEPLPAVVAVKEVFDSSAIRIMNTMRNELTDEDLKSVEESIALVNETLSGYEKSFLDAKTKAEADAKAWLESLKANRKAA